MEAGLRPTVKAVEPPPDPKGARAPGLPDHGTLQVAFCEVARRAGLRGPKGGGMSFHSLRHRFAVKRLIAWYEAGVNVQAMLPVLATYMGHVQYTDTAYYLTATAELLELAAERYYQFLGEEQ